MCKFSKKNSEKIVKIFFAEISSVRSFEIWISPHLFPSKVYDLHFHVETTDFIRYRLFFPTKWILNFKRLMTGTENFAVRNDIKVIDEGAKGACPMVFRWKIDPKMDRRTYDSTEMSRVGYWTNTPKQWRKRKRTRKSAMKVHFGLHSCGYLKITPCLPSIRLGK